MPTASTYKDLSKATTLITPAMLGKIEKDRKDQGHYIPTPTVAEIWRRHNWGKGYWEPRNVMINNYLDMHDLKSFYARDKKGAQAGATPQRDGELDFTVATFPHEILTYAMAALTGKHPYVKARPRIPEHSTDSGLKNVMEFEKFGQAILDMRITESSFLKPAVQSLMATGWLCTYYPYDPSLKDSGEFPYDLQLLSPTSVFPYLDARGRVLWVTIERRLNGAELLQRYGMFAGVMELFLAEADHPEGSYEAILAREPGNNFLTSDFDTVRYYDDYSSCLLVNASTVTDLAQRNNPQLKKLVERKTNKKAPLSVMHGSAKQDDNPYCGIEPHHLGRIPMGFVWMWPELRDATSLDVTGTGSSGANYSNSGSWGNLGGRLRGLPFIYSQRENWIRVSRIMSQLNTIMLANANAKIVTDSQTAKFDGKITRLEPGEDYKFMTPPPMPPEGLQLLKEMQSQVDTATFAPAARGAQAGTSGSQQRETYAAGTVRLDAVTTEIERCLQQYLYGVGATMLERGSEKLNVAGKGRGYSVRGAYAMAYDGLDKLKGSIPMLEVSIKSTNGLKNTEAVALFTNLATKSLLPFKMLVEQILDEPNGDMIKEELMDEKAQTEKATIQPRIDIATKKAQVEAFQEIWKLDDKLEELDDQKELELRQRKLAQDISQLPMEQQYQIQNQMLQQLMQIMGMNQGPSSAGGISLANRNAEPYRGALTYDGTGWRDATPAARE
jgi:hypothetical protein